MRTTRIEGRERQKHILEHSVCITLRRIIDVRVVEKFLYAEEYLNEVNTCEFPRLNGHTCLIVIAGFHDFSSSRIDRHTVPEGYTLGWNRGGVNLPG
jgi:hypothetical protein